MKFGEKIEKIMAFCVPKIDINVKLARLQHIVRAFQEKQYKLADEKLSDGKNVLSNISFILGTKSGFCVPETEVVFGPSNQCLYSITPLGVMLKGDEDQIFENLSYLPHYSNDEHFSSSYVY